MDDIDPGDELLDVVDEQDRVVGQATRREVRRRRLLHRFSSVLCRDPAGRLYVHRRTDDKDVYPGMYDMTAGGVLAAGETYLEAARRELAEELGVAGPEPRFLFRHRYHGQENPSWSALFEVTWDGPVRPQASEIAWGAFLTLDELDARLEEWPFCPDGLEVFRRWQAGDSLGWQVVLAGVVQDYEAADLDGAVGAWPGVDDRTLAVVDGDWLSGSMGEQHRRRAAGFVFLDADAGSEHAGPDDAVGLVLPGPELGEVVVGRWRVTASKRPWRAGRVGSVPMAVPTLAVPGSRWSRLGSRSGPHRLVDAASTGRLLGGRGARRFLPGDGRRTQIRRWG